jgi:hypothetical protein
MDPSGIYGSEVEAPDVHTAAMMAEMPPYRYKVLDITDDLIIIEEGT